MNDVELVTERLLLRLFRAADAADVQRLAGAPEVATGTFVPHPYEEGMAEAWIEQQARDRKAGHGLNFALVLREGGELVGSMGLVLNLLHRHAQLGYWIGVPYWGRGYCTEAGRAVLVHCFDVLGMHRVFAPHFTDNPASGRVLRKLGMRPEGVWREHFFHQGAFKDAELYGILRPEFEALRGPSDSSRDAASEANARDVPA